MSTIINSPDILAALQQRKTETGRKLKTSRQHIIEEANQLWAPMPKSTSRAHSISQLVSNGVFIYNSIRILASVISATRSLFGIRRKRRR